MLLNIVQLQFEEGPPKLMLSVTRKGLCALSVTNKKRSSKSTLAGDKTLRPGNNCAGAKKRSRSVPIRAVAEVWIS